jgi:hypothetical protein
MLTIIKQLQLRLLLLGSSLVVLCWPTFIYADPINGTLHIEAGLEQGLVLNCSKPLTFGVWFVQSADRTGGQTVIRIGPDTPGSLPSINRVSGEALGDRPGPGQGECHVSGSSATNGTELSITLSATSITLHPKAVLGQPMPTETTAIIGQRFRWIPSTPNPASLNTLPQLENGNASFAIGADLIIPNNLNPASFGGYSGSITITVTELL